MTDIDLDTRPQPEPASRRGRLLAVLTAPAPAALVVVLVALAVILIRLPDPQPATQSTPAVHAIRAATSMFPVRAVAQWRDEAGAWHTMPFDQDQPVRVPAREALVVVATDGAQCTLTVDNVTVDFATASAGQVAVCSWTAGDQRRPS